MNDLGLELDIYFDCLWRDKVRGGLGMVRER